MGGPHSWLSGIDMYRKVPVDLLQGTRQGNVVSWFTLFVIATLIFQETRQFLTSTLVTDLSLDSRRQGELDKVNVMFNITLMDLKCKYATINVISVLGNEQDIRKNIQRWDLDSKGVQQTYSRRNPDQHDIIKHDPTVTQTLESLHENGEDVVSLDPDSFDFALDDYEFVFVNYYASWCSHCQALHPTWERFAEVMHDAEDKIEQGRQLDEKGYEVATKLKVPVLIAKVDCVEYEDFCEDQDIDGYPTLKLYVNGGLERGGEYEGDRTILSLVQALIQVEDQILGDTGTAAAVKEHAAAAVQKHLNMTQDHEDWLAAMDRGKKHQQIGVWNPAEHPGCLIAGTLQLNRVPGRFFLQAHGEARGHNLATRMANLSHEINHLSFQRSDRARTAAERRGLVVPPNFEKTIHPMDGNVYVTQELHQSYHHYVKLISTNHDYYQVVQNSQLSFYQSDKVPEAKFVLDISPIAVHYRLRRKKQWYEYLTSLLAIVGGTFTVVGMLDSVLYLFTRQQARRKSMQQQVRRSAP